MSFLRLFMMTVFLVLAAGSVQAKNVTPSFMAEKSTITPETPFFVAVKFTLEKGWHTYYKEPGETGEATEISLHLPDGFKASKILWQKPKLFNNLGFTEYGYEDEVYHFIKITPPANLDNKPIQITADVTWLACGFGECVPGKTNLKLSLPFIASGQNGQTNAEFVKALQKLEKPEHYFSISPMENKTMDETDKTLPIILLLAFAGGIILNLMPCVFPVISLKIFGLLKSTEKTVRKNSVFYTLGIVTTFLLIAVVLVGVKVAGGSLGWGFQLQNPLFVLFMICLLVVLGMMFSGFLMLPPLIKGISAGTEGAFASGILAVLLASPCIAPFMGTAIVYGLTSSNTDSFLVFLFMGLGLAFPILLLSIWRGWVKYMPKSGPWLQILPKVLAIPLYLSALWLLWVLEKQTNVPGFVASIVLICLLALAVWFKKKLVWILVLLTFAGSLFLIDGKCARQNEPSLWQPYSEDTLTSHLAKGDAVFLKFSAAWCLTCLANEKLVLNDKALLALLKNKSVVLLAADWTAKDDKILKAINGYGKNGVPLYVYYKKGQNRPIILPQIITKKHIEKVIQNDS